VRGHYKGGRFTACSSAAGREVLAGILRPGNAGANNAEDHVKLLDWRSGTAPERPRREILARSDSAGASHDLADSCRECGSVSRFGYPLTEPVREALLSPPESAGACCRPRRRAARRGVGDQLTATSTSPTACGTRLYLPARAAAPRAQLRSPISDGPASSA